MTMVGSLMWPTSSERLAWAELSQAVVMIEVAKAAEVVRRKFDSPAAEGVSCGSTEESMIEVAATKKNGMQKPWTRNVRAMNQKSASVVKWLRQKAISAIHRTPKVTIMRGS